MYKKVITHITEWLQQQLNESRLKGYVLGLSGGLDSAVCAALVKRTSGECLGLILPIESDVADLDDAAEIASLIGLKTEYVDLTSIYMNLQKLLPHGERVALGNIKARLRMAVIYYYANLSNYLVCGTGNKTELTLGYFTKFGDGACDVLPIGDLYKYEVREIARELDIPDRIVTKTPSAGLWREQTDEGEIGFTYDQMDRTLQDIKDCRASGNCAKRLQEMIAYSGHKREPPKICYIKDN